MQTGSINYRRVKKPTKERKKNEKKGETQTPTSAGMGQGDTRTLSRGRWGWGPTAAGTHGPPPPPRDRQQQGGGARGRAARPNPPRTHLQGHCPGATCRGDPGCTHHGRGTLHPGPWGGLGASQLLQGVPLAAPEGHGCSRGTHYVLQGIVAVWGDPTGSSKGSHQLLWVGHSCSGGSHWLFQRLWVALRGPTSCTGWLWLLQEVPLTSPRGPGCSEGSRLLQGVMVAPTGSSERLGLL